MKQFFRNVCSPILKPLESGTEPFHYQASHRTILLVVSGLFSFLATLVVVLMPGTDAGHWIPVVVFGAVAALGFIVGLLGSDQAVAKIWGSRR